MLKPDNEDFIIESRRNEFGVWLVDTSIRNGDSGYERASPSSPTNCAHECLIHLRVVNEALKVTVLDRPKSALSSMDDSYGYGEPPSR